MMKRNGDYQTHMHFYTILLGGVDRNCSISGNKYLQPSIMIMFKCHLKSSLLYSLPQKKVFTFVELSTKKWGGSHEKWSYLSCTLPFLVFEYLVLMHVYRVYYQSVLQGNNKISKTVSEVGLECLSYLFFSKFISCHKTLCGSPPGVMMADTQSFNAKIGLVDFWV